MAPKDPKTLHGRQQPADQPMQKTLKGHPIPLPKRGEIMDAFKKITQGKKP